MAIQYVTGDATKPTGKGNKVIVHCCNDIGAWGAGFVLAISKRWKEPELEYKKYIRNTKAAGAGNLLGSVQLIQVEEDIYVANLIGQHGVGMKYGPPIRYNAISTGLSEVALQCMMKDASVHMPRIGCGLAGGSWDRIEECINSTLIKADIEVTVYDFKP